METTTIKLTLATLLGVALISGCAETPRLDEHFGEAVNMTKAKQTVNPDASLNQDPAAGIEGQAASGAMDRYYKSFQKPAPPTNVFTIGVGSGSGGMGTSSAGGTR